MLDCFFTATATGGARSGASRGRFAAGEAGRIEVTTVDATLGLMVNDTPTPANFAVQASASGGSLDRPGGLTALTPRGSTAPSSRRGRETDSLP
jgi:hypothetical protein